MIPVSKPSKVGKVPDSFKSCMKFCSTEFVFSEESGLNAFPQHQEVLKEESLGPFHRLLKVGRFEVAVVLLFQNFHIHPCGDSLRK